MVATTADNYCCFHETVCGKSAADIRTTAQFEDSGGTAVIDATSTAHSCDFAIFGQPGCKCFHGSKELVSAYFADVSGVEHSAYCLADLLCIAIYAWNRQQPQSNSFGSQNILLAVALLAALLDRQTFVSADSPLRTPRLIMFHKSDYRKSTLLIRTTVILAGSPRLKA